MAGAGKPTSLKPLDSVTPLANHKRFRSLTLAADHESGRPLEGNTPQKGCQSVASNLNWHNGYGVSGRDNKPPGMEVSVFCALNGFRAISGPPVQHLLIPRAPFHSTGASSWRRWSRPEATGTTRWYFVSRGGREQPVVCE